MSTSVLPSDIEIAQRTRMRPIEDVAAEIGLGRNELDLDGRYEVKLPLDLAAMGGMAVLLRDAPRPDGTVGHLF